MSSELFEPKAINTVDLKSPIISVFSEPQIKKYIRVAVEHFDRLEVIIYNRVIESPYYSRLIHWTIWDLIDFLLSFQNKSPCWFAHETRLTINEILLTPERCLNKHGYSGCWHPELNGLLIAIAIWEALLVEKYPPMRDMTRLIPPVYESLKELDESAAREYANPKLERNPKGSIKIHNGIQVIQKAAGDIVLSECKWLADRLKQSYSL